jgi:carbon-monoxide dehydrogenase small subunit
MLISARDLVRRLPDADEQRIRVGLSGNLCRCTGYVGIVRAVQSVIDARRARDIAPELGAGRTHLGPVGSGHAPMSVATSPQARPAAAPSPVTDAGVNIGAIPDFVPATVLEQAFTVAHPPRRVFELFGDVASVAACLPGASLTGTPTPERVDGAIHVKIGPISANFLGAARIERDPLTLSGRIVGIGSDRRSRSSTQGEIRYRLLPIDAGAATRVELSIGYSLTGMLAQIGRAGLVRDLASRLIATFAANLDRRLSGGASGESATELNGVSLVLAVLRERAASLFRRLSGKRGDGA